VGLSLYLRQVLWWTFERLAKGIPLERLVKETLEYDFRRAETVSPPAIRSLTVSSLSELFNQLGIPENSDSSETRKNP
jgi:hypothetical protein